MNFNPKSPILPVIALALTGVAGGIINSLIGTGAGIVIIFALTNIYAKNPVYSTKDIFATSLAVTMALSLISCALYAKSGVTDGINDFLICLPFAAAGGVLGGFLLDKLSAPALKKIFGALVVYAGASMLFCRK